MVKLQVIVIFSANTSNYLTGKTTHNIEFSLLDGFYRCSLTLQAESLNKIYTSNTIHTRNFTVDTFHPTVTFAGALTTRIKDPFDVTIAFGDPRTIQDFLPSDITVENGSVSSVSGSGNSRTATIIPQENFHGDVRVSMAANKVNDQAGNGNIASNILTQPVDTKKPRATIALLDESNSKPN